MSNISTINSVELQHSPQNIGNIILSQESTDQSVSGDSGYSPGSQKTALTSDSSIYESTSQNLPNFNDPSDQRRKRRQDWCRWPVCQQYRLFGTCANYIENLDSNESQLCQYAHINPTNSMVPITTDGYVRVCFDSMGLVQPNCQRIGCTFYHPPKYIRDQIVERRHEQYLREKVARNSLRNLQQCPPFIGSVHEPNPRRTSRQSMPPLLSSHQVPNLLLERDVNANSGLGGPSNLVPLFSGSLLNSLRTQNPPFPMVNIDPNFLNLLLASLTTSNFYNSAKLQHPSNITTQNPHLINPRGCMDPTMMSHSIQNPIYSHPPNSKSTIYYPMNMTNTQEYSTLSQYGPFYQPMSLSQSPNGSLIAQAGAQILSQAQQPFVDYSVQNQITQIYVDALKACNTASNTSSPPTVYFPTTTGI